MIIVRAKSFRYRPTFIRARPPQPQQTFYISHTSQPMLMYTFSVFREIVLVSFIIFLGKFKLARVNLEKGKYK